MSVPELTVADLTDGAGDRPLLVVGPSLGTSVATLWADVSARLGAAYLVLGWDLPGHGRSAPAQGFTLADLAAAVLAAVDRRCGPGTPFHYAGDSLGGAVGLQLVLDAPDRVRSATLCCTGAKIGEAEGWHGRAQAVRAGGTAVLLDSSEVRWFGPGFPERDPRRATALLEDLAGCDSESYAAACDALADFDVRPRLAEAITPLLALAGEHDASIPLATMRHLAAGTPAGRLEILDGVGHQAPAEAPDRVAELITRHIADALENRAHTLGQVRADGMRVRRDVLGDAHVDRALAGITALTQDFQDLITSYAWGSVWTRPVLDRRSRSLITLTALVARGHHEELAMHLQAARRNGLSNAEIAETLMQTAIYCGIPDANTAFRIAQRVLAEFDDPSPTEPNGA